MTNRPYEKVGKTYYPKTPTAKVNTNEVKGAAWRAWNENGQYYFEYDAGHFATKHKTVTISVDDFLALKDGRISDIEVAIKYG